MRVKICGITNIDDALHAIEAGADALGFVFYEKSPRYISPADAKEITSELPPFVERVGLFVNESPEMIDRVSLESGMSLAQVHFDVDREFIGSLKINALPVVRASSSKDVEKFAGSYRLVDAYCEGYGGSGKRLNLEWFEGVDCSKIILAGGLTPENVSELKQYGFYGVDVSSGTEASRGVKDPIKVEQFINYAKSI
ncbi:MAG: phosphoribosylanthranilate isomerase [Campylobacterota bacterium]|nr:phosphoribosylanthranilate isomerase [Campylobacterota bacterium]